MYCLVQNNTIVDGPCELPFEFLNMTGFDKIEDPTLFGWLPFINTSAPRVNDKQRIVTTDTITAKNVKRTYKVVSLTDDELSERTPRQVTATQFKLAMYNAGLLDNVSPDYKPVEIYWNSASHFERDNPYMQAISADVGFDLDVMLSEAAKL